MTDQSKSPVGYMSPPEHSRFKKGQSGNPKGRPPKPDDIYMPLQRVLKRKIKPKGADSQMAISEALIRKLREQALSGDRRALALQRKIMDEAGAAEARRFDPEQKKREILDRIRRVDAKLKNEGGDDAG